MRSTPRTHALHSQVLEPQLLGELGDLRLRFRQIGSKPLKQLAASSDTASSSDERDASKGNDVKEAGLDVLWPALRKRDLGFVRRRKSLPGELVLHAPMNADNVLSNYWLRRELTCVESPN